MTPISKFMHVIGLINRYGWNRWPQKHIVMANARVKRNTYVCAICKELHPRSNVQVDHKEPRVDPRYGYTTIDDYVSRTLVETDALQLLCKPCHHKKSAAENLRRKTPLKVR